MENLTLENLEKLSEENLEMQMFSMVLDVMVRLSIFVVML